MYALILTLLERFRETTLVNDVMYGIFWVHDAGLDLGEQGNQPQKTQSCPMSADTQEIARHAAQIHLKAGTEAALTELLRDLVQNCGSSHGQLTLASYRKGWVVFPCEFDVSRSTAVFIMLGVESDLMQSCALATGPPLLKCGSLTLALP